MGNPIENAAADLEQKLTEHLGNGLAASEAQARTIMDRLQGHLGVNLDKLETAASKIAGKLVKQRQKLEGNAYQGLFALGGRYPTIEEVITGLKTADPWTSHGLPVPGRLTATGPIGNDSDPLNIPLETVPGGPGPDPLPPPVIPPPVPGPGGQCPPGYTWGGDGAPFCFPNTGDLPCPPGWSYDDLNDPQHQTGCHPGTGSGPPTPPPPPTGLGPCAQAVRVYCSDTLQPPVTVNGQTAVQPVCWSGGTVPPEASWTLVTYSYIRPDGSGPFEVKVWIPGGWNLCVDRQDGTVYATEQVCTGERYCTIWPTPVNGPPGAPPPDPTPQLCAPPTLDPCPDPPPPLPSTSASGDDWCADVAAFLANLQTDTNLVRKMFAVASGATTLGPIASAVCKAITGYELPVLPGLWTRVMLWAEGLNASAANATRCTSAEFVGLTALQGAMNFVQKWGDFLPPQFVRYINQASNTLCQSIVPSPSEANAAFLADTIDKGEWQCYHQAAGNVLSPQERVLHGERTRPNAREVDLLYRRDQISSDEWRKRMRGNGVMTEEDIAAFHDLNQQWPDKADLIRYMQRDVFDEDVVRASGLDTDFEKKYTGDALIYAEALGLPENHLRYAWRSHWQLPSFTLAGQMLARNRPGKVPNDAVVNEADVVQLLKQDDWAPAWIPAMMEVLKQPLTRMDVRRMYQLHNATEQELKDYFLDLRYSDPDADRLVEFFKRQRDVAEAKASGLPTQRTLTNQYARGEVTGKELRDTLDQISLTPALAAAGMQSAFDARKVWRRAQVIKGIKRQYIAGLIDDGDATNVLAREEVDAAEITELLELWALDQRDRGKHASGAQLCKWRSLNLIAPNDQLKALVRTGWSVVDAERIVSQCELELTEKQRKAAERLAKQQETAYEKLKRQERQAAKERGEILPPRSRKITVKKDAKGATITDTETIPVMPLPGAPEDVAAGL